MNPKQRQLVLPVSIDPSATWEHWVSRPETKLLEHALTRSLVSTPPGIFVWGYDGLGKSHLLQAVCAELGSEASYIPLATVLETTSTELLEQMESGKAVVIDDIHLVVDSRSWQEALFHCFNRCMASGTPLVVSSRLATSGLAELLPDLRSRIALLTGFRLPNWDLESFEQLLCQLAKHRGLIFTQEVARYLTRRLRQTPSEALAAIEKIERSSLIEQRTPTVPFLKTLGL